jgi:hypothetical protein
MRELIERLSYRFQLWQKERYGDRWGADPTAPRNPLRFVAVIILVFLILDATEPFVFRRGLDILAIARIPTELLFLILYRSKSKWAWHLIVAWVPFAFFAYWILRFTGYSHYQPRVKAPLSEFIAGLFNAAFFVVVFVWLLRIRERYFRYSQDARSQQT